MAFPFAQMDKQILDWKEQVARTSTQNRKVALFFVKGMLYLALKETKAMENSSLFDLNLVYRALTEKGYCPTAQIAGYILSGDPAYITNHAGARQIIARIDRFDLLRDMLIKYFHQNADKK